MSVHINISKISEGVYMTIIIQEHENIHIMHIMLKCSMLKFAVIV